jgi:hypothetical protein
MWRGRVRLMLVCTSYWDASILKLHDLLTVSAADPSEWFVLPQEFYSEEFTFFGHSPGGTWHEDDVAVVLWFVAHPVTFWVLVFAVLTGLVMVVLRLRKNRDKSGVNNLGSRGV